MGFHYAQEKSSEKRGTLNLAIVGEGATGMTAAFYARRTDPTARITVYSDEPNPPYYRPALTNYLMGELRAQQLFATPPSYYQDLNVDRVLTRVNGVDGRNQRLYLSDGQTPAYDRLVLAAGARPALPVDQINLGGVMPVRTIQDVRFIVDLIHSGRMKRAVVIGDGILALELAAGLRARDVEVTYLLRGNTIMPEVLDQPASDLVVTRCRHYGIDVRQGEQVAQLHAGPAGWVQGVTLTSGARVATDWLGIAIGIRPNIEFLEGSGITTRKGIPVDASMRSNLENVFAGGDIAEISDRWLGRPRVIGLWEPARHHGRVAGINMAGGSSNWEQDVPYTATRLHDLDLGAVGESLERPGDHVEVDFPARGSAISYRKIILREDKLVGALLLGTRKEGVRKRARLYRKLIQTGIDVSSIANRLLDPTFDLRGWMQSLGSDPALENETDRAVAGKMVADFGARAGGEAALPGPEGSPPTVSTRAADTGRTLVGASFNLAGLVQARSAGGGPRGAEPAGAPAAGTQGGMTTLRLPSGELFTVADRVVIGSSDQAQLRLADPTLLPFHAEIRGRSGDYVVAPYSGAEIFVNDQPVLAPRTLVHADVIRLGAQELEFVQQVAAPRAETGPVGLPAEPLERVAITPGASFGALEWTGGAFDIAVPVFQIGRGSQEAEVVLDDPAVSWLHAEVTEHQGTLYVRDLGSSNGTYVNGELVVEPRPLHADDVIRLGETDLIYRTSGATGRSRTPAGGTPAPPRTSSGEARLVGKAGSMLGVAFSLSGETMTIGRDEPADIVVGDAFVSRLHATLSAQGQGWIITDTGSTNGSFVNGERLEANVGRPLSPGDEVVVGHAAFTFEQRLEQTERRQETVMLPKPVPGDAGKPQAAPETQVSRLTVRVGMAVGQVISLDELPLVLGRVASSGVAGLDDEFVSARHAEVYRGPGDAVFVKDLGSTNGTFVNEARIQPGVGVPLNAGTVLRLGSRTSLEAE